MPRRQGRFCLQRFAVTVCPHIDNARIVGLDACIHRIKVVCLELWSQTIRNGQRIGLLPDRREPAERGYAGIEGRVDLTETRGDGDDTADLHTRKIDDHLLCRRVTRCGGNPRGIHLVNLLLPCLKDLAVRIGNNCRNQFQRLPNGIVVDLHLCRLFRPVVRKDPFRPRVYG